MEKQIKIINSPYTSPLEVAGNIIIKLHVPYSDSEVTVKINPSIQEYIENQNQPGIEVSQLMIESNTDETETLKFDFQDNNIKTVTIDDENYEIRLMNIGKENLKGQDFQYFEFFIKW